MIPASYLFKDIYRQHWQEPDAIPTASEPHQRSGLVVPSAQAGSVLHALRVALSSRGILRHVHT